MSFGLPGKEWGQRKDVKSLLRPSPCGAHLVSDLKTLPEKPIPELRSHTPGGTWTVVVRGQQQ